MYYNHSDTRIPLSPNSIIDFGPGNRYVVIKYLGCGGFSLAYLAHKENSNNFVVIKELYPRNIDNAVAERKAAGKITIRNPLSESPDTDNKALWDELNAYFLREVALTHKAGSVFSASGIKEPQNNPDVLKVDGPLVDIKGNTYLLIDTYQGESLRDYIERGFITDTDGKVIATQSVAGIIDILIKTSLRLSHLHRSAHIYHLDLSCDNIYLAKSAGGTSLEPYIIDYGAAYSFDDPTEEAEHRFTYNPHSAPEVLALAQLQDLGAGYKPDESSDTYSLVSILFYAVTGKLFVPELRTFRSEWKDQIRREYSSNIPGQAGEDSFSNALIDFFDKGLSVIQSERYTSAKELITALRLLKKKYQEYGNLLPLIDPDELTSYMVLEKHPLYNYLGTDGNIHVVCFGCGKFVKQMILSILSIGQMADSHLNIHIVSSEPESLLWAYLKAAAPDLPLYSNLDGDADTAHRYVLFSYDCVEDIANENTCAAILKKYSYANYFLISLGHNSTNAEVAQLCARLFCYQYEKHPKTIINYYRSEDAANNTRSDITAFSLPDWLDIDSFSDNLSSYSRTLRALGIRTLKLAHLYNKLENPRISLADSAKRLAVDKYNQRSSCASALHLKYKLASIGINPAPSTNIRAIVNTYQKALASDKFGVLLELEHRRWMMYMLASGYRAPTYSELKRYGFDIVDGSFNADWKCTAKKLHPCLVPSTTSGITIQAADWDFYNTREAIEECRFDDLDKISLTLHLLSKKKCLDIVQRRAFEPYFADIEAKLVDAQEDFASENKDISANPYFAAARKRFLEVKTAIHDSTSRLGPPIDSSVLDELEQAFDIIDLNISGDISGIKQLLSVFSEYAAYKDYKKPDSTIVNNLLWILYSKNDLPLIKLRGRTIADNITGPIILEPNLLYYFGIEAKQSWIDFLRGHGLSSEISFVPYCGSSVSDVEQSLSIIVKQCRNRCIIDITGADELMVIAAQKIAAKNEGISLVRSTAAGRIENIFNFAIAPAYSFNTALSAVEVYALHGARKIKTEANRYMAQLSELVPAMWKFYREFQDSWEMITAFFAHRRCSGSGIWLNNITIDQHTRWKRYTRDTVAWSHWERLQLTEIFGQLNNAGFIRDLSIERSADKAVLSFSYPAGKDDFKPDFVLGAMNKFFSAKVPLAYSPFSCNIERDENSVYTIDIKSSCLVDCNSKKPDFSDQRYQRGKEEKRYPYANLVQPLTRMEELGLISNLEISVSGEKTVNAVKFVYSNLAVKECFLTAGNILELYVWNEAVKTREFDACDTNFSFSWEEGVKNELDVVLTHGLGTLVISCKTAKFNKEHLYEIKYLTERFSLNSKPVIVYSSTLAVEEGHLTDDLIPVKNRAKAMGVYLIDLNTLDCSLGEKLVRIANGQDMP